MPSDYERAYSLALAVRNWGYDSNEEFARKMADIAAAQGLMAACRAISDECLANGVQMSPQRLLKGLVHVEAQSRQPPPPPLSSTRAVPRDYSPQYYASKRRAAARAAWARVLPRLVGVVTTLAILGGIAALLYVFSR